MMSGVLIFTLCICGFFIGIAIIDDEFLYQPPLAVYGIFFGLSMMLLHEAKIL